MQSQAEANLHALIESTEDVVWSVDLNHRLVTFNRALKRHIAQNFGTVASEGLRPCDLLSDSAAELWPPFYDRALAGGAFRTELPISGGRTLELSFNPIVVKEQTTGVSVFGKDITERKTAEQALQAAASLGETDNRLRRFFEENSSVMLLANPTSGEIVAANRTAAAFYGYSQQQLRGMPISQLNGLAYDDILVDSRRAFEEECNFFRRPHTLASGEVRDVEIYVSRFSMEGRPVLFSIIHDVTERRRAEVNLRDSEERYRASFDQAAVGIVHASFDGRILRCNNRFAEIVGYNPEEVPGMTYQQITWPGDVGESEALVQQLATGAADNASWEKCYVRKDGSLTWVKLTSSAQRDGNGELLHIITFVEDINARKQAEARLAETQKSLLISESRYRTVFETSLDPITITRWSDGRYVDVNQAMLDYMGFGRNEVIGLTSAEVGVWVDPADRQRLFDKLQADSGCRNFETQLRAKSGRVLWGRISANMMDFEGVRCILSVTSDITESKMAAEEVLRISEERLWLALQLVGIGTFEVDSKAERWRFSPQMLKIFGLGADHPHPIAKEVLAIFHPEDLALIREKRALLITGKPVHYEHRIVRPDGEVRWVEVTSHAVMDDAGKPIRSSGAAYDITERKLAENSLRRSQDQLRALSARLQTAVERERLRIARELHDQLGPELTCLKMDLAWAVRKHGKSGDTWIPLVQDSMKSIDSTIALVRKLATELRPEMLDALGLSAAIEWHSEHFQRRAGIRCKVQVPEESIDLSSDQQIAVFRIYQEAMTNVARHSKAKVALITIVQEAAHAMLSIVDDGIGFAVERMEQTQSLGVLGMRERALLLGADFQIESTPGRGTAITLRIPLKNSGPREQEDHEDIDR